MTSLKQSTVQEGLAPQVPQNGMVTYGSGLVFGGKVYPVLVDGVPMQQPLGAHQAALQQRMQMQQVVPQRMQMQQVLPQAPPTHCPKPIVQYPTYQQTGNPFPAPPYISKPSQQSSVSCPGPVMAQQHSTSSNNAMMQPLQAQILQRQQMQTAMGTHGYYNVPTNAGGDSSGWDGYAMMQPMDANKPYSFGWSLTD
ncbi:uncharacterized protein LOC6527287 [Drosophila yakuba]|uniref:Uncharacterized protein n=1 Tax=Drosophila yakuba TaxID=7245 RepID=B4P1I6_DROYA|nr:uncharacterized protein LOC6527287 [Drosophila yakuba]EDW88093.2 uncharacterized protein Dyak_GE12741 [Drosophila yakuba]